MSDPALGLLMLSLIVVVIMLGFPTAFTLMGLGMVFGFIAFYDPSHSWADNKVFDLMVERTYGAMNNDVLISIPLFVLMGYVMERGALVDKMFYSIQLAFRRVPASLAVATLIVCTFWGIASGLVGAVVVLMGVIAFNPMLKAGYDVKLASGVITAGGTLGILIPPSVMIIVYAAVAGQSVVKLYASAMFPGFFLSFLYLVYIIGWALINPKIAPKLPEDQQKVPVPAWIPQFQQAYAKNMLVSLLMAVVSPRRARAIAIDSKPFTYGMIWKNLLAGLFPLILCVVTLWGIWWYVVIHPVSDAAAMADSQRVAPAVSAPAGSAAAPTAPAATDQPQELGSSAQPTQSTAPADEGVQQVGTPELLKEGGPAPVEGGPPQEFFTYFWITAAATALLLLWYYWKMEAESFELLKLLSSSVMPLGILTIVVLAVILFGITTATESAAIGAAGAFILALQARTFDWERLKQSVFLTAKTTAMVCWLFIGSALFSGVFAILGGQQLVETWVLGLNMTPIQFMILSQAIIFVLGWPLEWTEIIVIFVPIFLPLLKHFNIDPILWGTLVFVNLQAAFLSPPVAMSAFYLKGVAPKHVTLNQIFAGMMPYMIIVIICMVIMYLWPGMTLWLPNYLYGG
ncbi:MAG TPA: TRAP transporter large permease subunit [Usitatibacter sp.]|nr:TRAP transporter large permease subunit [Usitatibacter sp.]